MPVIAITRLRVRSWSYLPVFVIQTLRIARQAARADGSLAVMLLRDRGNAFWTSTGWSSEASMKAFMHAKPHGPTMRSLLGWCDEASLVHWTQGGPDLPRWDAAHRRLETDGRPSTVNHPSAAHTALRFPPPVVRRTNELHFKRIRPI
jgi:hypothetical protein